MINVVHPAYHWLPNGGQGSFCEVGNRLLSCVRVFATGGGEKKLESEMCCQQDGTWSRSAHSAGYVMAGESQFLGSTFDCE
jgi:hypothetical protein